MWTLFVAFAMLMIGNGLNLAVLGVRMVEEGFGVQTSGAVMACYFAGFLLGPVLVVRWLSGVGHIRVFASLASIASCVVLLDALLSLIAAPLGSCGHRRRTRDAVSSERVGVCDRECVCAS